MSSVKRAPPVMRLGSSLRSLGAPMFRDGCSVVAISPPLALRDGRDGLHGVVVARAAAEVALEAVADVLLGRPRVLVQEPDRRHDHPGRAEAALEPMVLLEGRLHRVHLAVGREALDGGDLRPVRLDREHAARLHGLAVDVDGAGAAGDGVAAHVRAGEVEVLAEEVDEQPTLLDLRLPADAVHGDGDAPHVVSPLSRPKPNSRLMAPTTAVTASDRPETGFCASSTAAARSSGAADS